MIEEWISINDAAELSGYHPEHLRRLIRDGNIDARKFGPLWQVNFRNLMEYKAIAEKSDDKRRGPKPN